MFDKLKERYRAHQEKNAKEGAERAREYLINRALALLAASAPNNVLKNAEADIEKIGPDAIRDYRIRKAFQILENPLPYSSEKIRQAEADIEEIGPKAIPKLILIAKKSQIARRCLIPLLQQVKLTKSKRKKLFPILILANIDSVQTSNWMEKSYSPYDDKPMFDYDMLNNQAVDILLSYAEDLPENIMNSCGSRDDDFKGALQNFTRILFKRIAEQKNIESAKPFLPLLFCQDYLIKAYATECFLNLQQNTDEVLDALLSIVKNGDSRHVRIAYDPIGSAGIEARNISKSLWSIIKGEEVGNPENALIAIERMKDNIQPIIPDLITGLYDSDAKNRRVCASIVGRLSYSLKDYVPQLIDIFGAKEPITCYPLIPALGRLQVKEAIDPILKLLFDHPREFEYEREKSFRDALTNLIAVSNLTKEIIDLSLTLTTYSMSSDAHGEDYLHYIYYSTSDDTQRALEKDLCTLCESKTPVSTNILYLIIGMKNVSVHLARNCINGPGNGGYVTETIGLEKVERSKIIGDNGKELTVPIVKIMEPKLIALNELKARGNPEYSSKAYY